MAARPAPQAIPHRRGLASGGAARRLGRHPRAIHRVIRLLRGVVSSWRPPAVGVIREETGHDPFHVLVSCLISLRTKDHVTEQASRRLFQLARTPAELVRVPIPVVEQAIYPAGFYRTKARTLRHVAQELLDRFGGRVPDTLETLLSMKGIGRKTANLVVTLAFGKPGICVDTHVHRITNRWGYVRTRTPEQTEAALRATLPRAYWNILNDLLVPYGQHCCTPLSPWCSRCVVAAYCARRGVTRAR